LSYYYYYQNDADENGNDELAIKSIIASVTIDVKLLLYTTLKQFFLGIKDKSTSLVIPKAVML